MSYICPFPLTLTKKISTLNNIEVYGYIVTKRKGLGPTNSKMFLTEVPKTAFFCKKLSNGGLKSFK